MPAGILIQDVIGPIMVGPSSSHTAGALAIAAMTRRLLEAEPKTVEFKLYGSFAYTYKGHGTDRALTAGILGLGTDDPRVRDSLQLAQDRGVSVTFTPCPDEQCDHPNTVDILVTAEGGHSVSVRGESIGGGAARLVQIDGMRVEVTGKSNSLVVRQRDVKGVLAYIASTLTSLDINIATVNMYRTGRGGEAFTVIELDEPLSAEGESALLNHPNVIGVRNLPAQIAGPTVGAGVVTPEQQERAADDYHTYHFRTGKSLIERCDETGLPISEVFLRRNACMFLRDGMPDPTDEYLRHALQIMRQSATAPLEAPVESIGGLIGGEAFKVKQLNDAAPQELSVPMVAHMVQYALAVLETNASMGCIVAAPTAGSAGVIPAALLALQEAKGLSDGQLVRGLANAAAVGYLISRNATVSGADGGCQAEVGSASAMAASAIVELTGGTPRQCLTAASNALTNLMGLVCDPIAGLVEVPCQKRNATAAANALISAEIALAGVENLVDFDQTVEAMRQVGGSIPAELRETALGGIAATPSACDFCSGCMH